ncbi:MAG: hypothetical protein ACYC4L_10835 [Chloroflexota bacterium]
MRRSAPGSPVYQGQREYGSDAESEFSRWQGLYRVGGAAAALTAVITPVAMAVFIAWPPPLEGTAQDWFTLFQSNQLLGLLGLDLLFMLVYALLIPIFLALYASLRRASESAMALAATLGFIAIAVYFASNPAFEMLSLSESYAAATTDLQRSMYLAAGEAVLASFQGTAFKVSYLLATAAGVIIAFVILRSKVLSRTTGYVRLLASVLGLGLFVPVVGVPLALFSVNFEWIWYVLLARELFRLGRSGAY